MSFQGSTALRGALLVLLALSIASCGGHSDEPLTASPTFSEGTGTYIGTQTITITDTDTSVSIYYTTDGSEPTTASTAYTAPVPVGSSLTLEAIAVSAGHRNSSVASATYVIAPAALPTAGIWLGTDSVTGDKVIALINAAGNSIFVRSDYTQFAGNLTVTNAAISAPLTGYANFPGTFADGSITGSGTLTATVNEFVSIIGTLAFTSSDGTSYPANYSLGYVDTSASGSASAAIAGSYTDDGTNDPNTGATITIAVNSAATTPATAATIVSSGAASGCVMTGTLTTADQTTDIYEVAYTYAGCTGAFSPLNGLALTGLAALNSSNTPVQLLVAVNGPGGGATSYGLVSSLILN